MNNVIALIGAPVGMVIASALDPDALDRLAQVCERHPAFAVIVLAGFLLNGGGRLWLLQSHSAKAKKAAFLDLAEELGVVKRKVSKARKPRARRDTKAHSGESGETGKPNAIPEKV